MVKLSSDLWDGFEHICAKTELGLTVLKDVTEFLKKRVQLEAEYAKKLQELSKTVPGSGMFSKAAPIDKESKTMKAAFLSLQEEGAKVANNHFEYATKLNNDVVKPLENFLKTKEPERKKHIAEGQKRNKVYLDAKVNHDRAKDAYGKAFKESEQATDAYEKAKTEHENGADAKKKQLAENEKRAAQKAAQASEKVKAAEAAYVKAVDTANEVSKETFGTHLPPVIDALQTLEEERYAQCKAVFETFHREFRALPDFLIDRAEALSQALSALDVDTDLSDFVQEKKGPASVPEEFRFIPAKEPVAEPSSSTTTTTTTTETKTEEVKTEETKPEEPKAEETKVDDESTL